MVVPYAFGTIVLIIIYDRTCSRYIYDRSKFLQNHKENAYIALDKEIFIKYKFKYRIYVKIDVTISLTINKTCVEMHYLSQIGI
jgi:hypothetical protein